MRLETLTLAVALVVATGSPAAAQDTVRRAYPFLGNELTIVVVSPPVGSLQLTRGGTGLLEVAGQARGGIISSALGGVDEDELRLSAADTHRADFAITVPDKVLVKLRTPGRWPISVPWVQPAASFAWNTARGRQPPTAGGRGTGVTHPLPTTGAGPPLAYASGPLPAAVDLTHLDHVRWLDVRLDHGPFRINAHGSIRVSGAGGPVLHVDAAGASGTVRLYMARDATLILRIAGNEALRVRHGDPTVVCLPYVAQVLPDESQWIRVTPRNGRWLCPLPGKASHGPAGAVRKGGHMP